jgi:hypothetical protein
VFEGNTPMAVLIQHVREQPPSMSSRTELHVPPRLEKLIQACLAKHPSDRPASAEAVGAELAQIAAGLPAWTRERAEKWWRTNLPDLYAAPRIERLDSGASTVVNV